MTTVPDLATVPDDLADLVVHPGTDGYERSRTIYNNRMAHQRPSTIVRAESVVDVQTVVRHAAERELTLGVRCGGHGVDGSAMPDDALVLDLTAFKEIGVDHDTQRVRIGAGVLLGEMDTQLIQHGLVVPAGTVSTTGVAGLTLGGGVGFNMRRYGASVDNLISCDVVTTDGRLVRASEADNPDLFWALRGGGGNFGVVTSFEFQGRPMQPTVSAGMIPYTIDQGADVLRALREFMETAPRELGLIVSVVKCPPLPPIPVEVHGKEVVMFVLAYTGPADQAGEVINQLAACGTPAAIAVDVVPWPVANSMIDALAPSGRRVYTKGAYLAELYDEVTRFGMAHEVAAPPPTAWPTPSTVQEYWSLSGAIRDDYAEDSCAFSREGATWFWEGASFWEAPSDDLQYMTWLDDLYAKVRPHALKNCYINLTTDMGPEWRKGAWGSAAKYRRLVEAKSKWDPANMLRHNKNIDLNDMVSAVPTSDLKERVR